MELTERKLRILQAIISDYVKTAEPVGSRTISKKYDLGISPATIRNEMADLEEMGYLTHPHTSAGRVPSDMAYRLYVNALMEKKELSKEEKNVIAERLHSNVYEFEKTIEHAATVLSEITNLTSFALTPSKNEDALKFIVTRSRNFKETNPDVIDFTQVTGCELDVSEREREEKRKDADGKMVSYNPPRYEFEYDLQPLYFDPSKTNKENEMIIRQAVSNHF